MLLSTRCAPPPSPNPYELLVGTTPFDPEELRESSYDQVCRIIRETEPQTPSKRLSTLWDLATTETITLGAHTTDAYAVVFSPDGRTLASSSRDRTVKLWHVTTGQELLTLKTHAAVTSLAFFPDGKTLAAGCADKTIKLWDVKRGEEVLRRESM